MICLGIESTAHTFSIGIIDDKGKILANLDSSYKPTTGGIHPGDAAKHHEEVCDSVLETALKEANLELKNIDIISFSQGPGLPPCLKVGKEFALKLSKKTKKPLIGVNHCVAHIEIGKLTTNSKDPIVLYLSGGNSQVIGYSEGTYRVFGETLDIAIGNAIDKFARKVNLGFPGGPKIEELAKKGKYIELPYTVKGMDFSFTGIVSHLSRDHEKHKLEDVCYSFEETAFSMLTEVTERALSHTEKREVLLVGGVAANKRMQRMLNIMCKERGAEFHVVKGEYSGDCGIMIAWTGLLEYKSTKKPTKDIDIRSRWRTDETPITWM